MFPLWSGILAEAVRIASTSLQQRQSISLASFFQCPHLHQLRFRVLICNKSVAISHGSHYHKVFSVRAQTVFSTE